MIRRIAFLATLLAPALASAQEPTPPPGASPAPSPSAPPAATDATPPPAAPTPAPPQPAPPPPEVKSEPPEVRVIGSKPDSLQRIPGSGTIITEKDIQRAEPAEVSEMLRRVPGVQANQDYGGGGRLDIGIRGLDPGRSRHQLVLEDGIPISLNPYAEPDIYYAPPIERMRGIEVVKGSGSILFGPQTIGGVINFLTLSPPTHQHATADFEGGNYGYARALANYGDAFGSARYIVQALYRRGDGFRNDGFEQTNLLGKLVFDTSNTGEATLKIGFQDDSDVSGDVGLTRGMYATDPRQSTLTPNDKLHLRRYDISITHDQRLSENVKLKTLIYAYDTNRIWNRQDYVRAAFPGESFERTVGDPNLPNGAIYFQNTDTVLDRDYQVAGLEPRIEHRFTTGPVAHTMDYGARLLGETAHYQQRTGEDPTSNSGTLDDEEKHQTIAAAAYAQDRIAFGDKLLVTPGFRVEHAAFHRIILREPSSDGTTHDASLPGDTQSTGLIPGIGIIYGTRDAHVFGGLHVGWAPPRITSSIAPKGMPTQVSAEQSTNWEIGSRVSPLKWVKAELTGFVTEFQNQVVVNTAGPSADTSGEIDAGETRHYGVETGLVTQIGRALGWRDTAFDVGARYTFAHAAFVGGQFDGNLLPYAPLHAFNMNVDVEHRSGFAGEIAWVHVSSQFTDAPNTIAEDATGRVGEMPAYDILNGSLRYRHKPSGLTARLNVKNALDATYIYARRPEGIFTGAFRTIMLGLRWDWDHEPPPPGATQ